MTPHSERYHALDAVRASALLLGVALHAAASFLEGFPIPIWKDTPNVTPTVMYYIIHMFRMSTLFFRMNPEPGFRITGYS